MAVKRIDHVGVAVSDLDAAPRFLTDVLGMATDGERALLPEQHLGVQFAQCGDDKIELISPMGEDSPISRASLSAAKGSSIFALRSMTSTLSSSD